MTSTTASPASARRRNGRHPGPPLAAPVLVSAAAWLVGAVVLPLAVAGSTMPDPTADPRSVAGSLTATASSAAWTAALLVLSGTMLVAAGALLSSRLVYLAPNAPGPLLAGHGAASAGVLLSLSGALTWATSVDAVREDTDVVVAVHAVAFVAGGACVVVALGVATLGLAVTTLFVARTPRALSLVGVALAVADLLAFLVVAVHQLAPLLLVCRVLSLVWLAVVCLLLPRDRGPRGTR
ncbi:hypothetical protein GCM10011519_25410 [Marmoricola endophyticus]|uniref:DUF4386 domain-containing protein n=1 Tax=Marmoricola endophyticus TaxID=2040280 RepID=A0A917F4T4_9ACTN|nr:hypothetical protein [Marmoricola endophyticus]GGF50382.1 hypothetical protein GCM10011519_25410 [Marmoricola endophyticus]